MTVPSLGWGPEGVMKGWDRQSLHLGLGWGRNSFPVYVGQGWLQSNLGGLLCEGQSTTSRLGFCQQEWPQENQENWMLALQEAQCLQTRKALIILFMTDLPSRDAFCPLHDLS